MNEELLIKLELNLASNDAILFYQFNWQDDFHFLPKENQEQIEKKKYWKDICHALSGKSGGQIWLSANETTVCQRS